MTTTKQSPPDTHSLDKHTHKHIGVLLVNLGTPDAPTPKAIRKYLFDFLSDQRVIETPKFLWWPILLGVILPLRPRALTHSYELMWQSGNGDSPLRTITEQQKSALQERLQEHLQDQPSHTTFSVEYGMTYGKPSIQSALERLSLERLDQLIVLPLFPQYSATSSAASFDVLAKALKRHRNIPHLTFLKDYHDDPDYIAALAQSVRDHWQEKGRQGKLLFSFHGIPQAYVDKGDPYQSQCDTTAQLIAQKLALKESEWAISFQSRVGKAQWLKPYTDKTLAQWGSQKLNNVDVICPGFSVDCLETLEEIDMQNRALFEKSGGSGFHYIPALNATPSFIETLKKITLSLS
ncbi:MAG: ferrochelatase [Gammaproteobacteria bacterium]|nr:MAG: ferrochelatase [Gammaproteobacteria bacterium]